MADAGLRLLFAALFLWSFGVGLYEGLIPIFARQLGATPVQLGTLFTIRHLALAAGYLIGIAVADRLGRQRVMLLSWVCATPVPLLLALAPGYLWLLPGLLLYEVTFFGLPAMHAYVSARVPASRLASTFAAQGMLTSSAFLIAPTLGGAIADWRGIRTTLVVAAVFYGLSMLLILRLRAHGDDAGPAAPVPLRVADLRPLAPLLAIHAALTLVVLTAYPFVTPFLREVRRLSLTEIGFLGSMQAVGGVVVTLAAGRAGDRAGVGPAMSGALGVLAVGLAATVAGPAALLPVAAALRARAPLHGLGQSLIGAGAPRELAGRIFATAGMISALLSAGGVLAGGFAYRTSPALPLWLSVGMAMLLASAVWRVRPRHAA